jgi:hypothetical protein
MKKLFLGLIATVMFCFAGNAQSKEEAMSKLYKTSMVSLVDNGKSYYKEGMSYKQFIEAVSPLVILSKEENAVVTDVYNFLTKKTDTGVIFNEYDQKSLKALVSMPDSQTPVAARCGFLCWLKTIKDIIEIIIAVIG